MAHWRSGRWRERGAVGVGEIVQTARVPLFLNSSMIHFCESLSNDITVSSARSSQLTERPRGAGGEGSVVAHSCAIFLFYLGGEIYHLVGQLTTTLPPSNLPYQLDSPPLPS